MIRNLIKKALKNKLFASYLRSIYAETRLEIVPEASIVEASLIHCRKSHINEARLNILVPALSLQHVFGGIDTALSFFMMLGKEYKNLRIILTDQSDFKKNENPSYLNWNICALDDDDKLGKWIVNAGDRYQCNLPVGPKDTFMATAWWTAISAKYIQKWQVQNFSLNHIPKFVYFIQDFEPGFYPWSSRYALAESTYYDTDNAIAIFNTRLLKSFFDNESFSFKHAYVFEPSLHPKLKAKLNGGNLIPREKRVLIYGRPNTVRNAFQTIVMALRERVTNHPNCEWEFVSVGEQHPPILLGNGKYLNSLGKLSLDDYVVELSKASVGISLMISPHPSYPPLEMAAFGINTITNSYKSKNLSLLNSKIFTIHSVDPLTLANALDIQISSINNIQQKYFSNSITSPEWNKFLETSSDFERICEKIKPLLMEI